MNDLRRKKGYELLRSGDLDGAAQILGAALIDNPADFDALYLLGTVAIRCGDFVEADRLFVSAKAIRPQALDLLYNHGLVLERLKRRQEALASFDALLALKPAIVEGWIARGNVLIGLQRNEEAAASFDRALNLNPDAAEAWANLGVAQSAMGRFEDALASFARRLAIREPSAEVLAHRAKALCRLHRYSEGIADYRRALAINPALPYVPGDIVFAQLSSCDWALLEADAASVHAGVSEGKRVVQAGIYLSLAASADMQSRCAKVWAENEVPAQEPLWRGERYDHRRLRIAYISADFADSVVANTIAGVFEHHDRDRFETIGIALNSDDGSAVRTRVKNAFGRFADASADTDRGAAELIRNMEIDIAVDLMGYTAGCRPGILAFRPAPIQVNYLGYPGTMAAGHIDYILADRVVIPEEHKPFYSERVVWLPGSYLPYDSARRPRDRIPTRAEAGLPEEGFVFACFNNAYKFAPESFAVWMQLLRSVEGSVLWLPKHDGNVLANLRCEAERHGVSPDRLIFASYAKTAEDHLARLSLADLFLDTWPYGAHSTASDALRAGVPVVTVLGDAFPGRVAASLLSATGLPELIAASVNDYESLALRFARDPGALAAIRAKLQLGRESLFDTAGFTRHLEAAFLAMQERYARGEAPSSFAVK